MWKKIKRWWRRKQNLKQFRKDTEYHTQKAKAFGKWIGSQDPSKFISQSASPRSTGAVILDEFAKITPEGNKLFDNTASRLNRPDGQCVGPTNAEVQATVDDCLPPLKFNDPEPELPTQRKVIASGRIDQSVVNEAVQHIRDREIEGARVFGESRTREKYGMSRVEYNEYNQETGKKAADSLNNSAEVNRLLREKREREKRENLENENDI